MFIFFQTWIACANLTAYMTESIWKDHVTTVWLSEPRDLKRQKKNVPRQKDLNRRVHFISYLFIPFLKDFLFMYSSDTSKLWCAQSILCISAVTHKKVTTKKVGSHL
jgi:hypothetical protein